MSVINKVIFRYSTKTLYICILIKLERLKIFINYQNSTNKTKQLISRFYSTLTKSEMWDLYERYKLDFELFGYTPDEYFGYATEDESTPSYEP